MDVSSVSLFLIAYNCVLILSLAISDLFGKNCILNVSYALGWVLMLTETKLNNDRGTVLLTTVVQ